MISEFQVNPIRLQTRFFVQIETGSGDKQTNINLVSREDFERLKNFQEPETNGVVSPEVCFCSAGTFLSCPSVTNIPSLSLEETVEPVRCERPRPDDPRQAEEGSGVQEREGGGQVLPRHQGAGSEGG